MADESEHDLDVSELAGTDPHDVLAREAARIERHFDGLVARGDDAAWSAPSRCEGWSVRDVLAHLDATEDYHRACLDGGVARYIAAAGERGATDLTSANALFIAELADRTPAQLLDEWRTKNRENRDRLRERGDGDIDSSVGAYPARLQAWHLASELATHADDAGVPETPEEADDRHRWRARFSRVALAESHAPVSTTVVEGGTLVAADGVEMVVDDATLVEAVAGRLPPASSLPVPIRAGLNITP